MATKIEVRHEYRSSKQSQQVLLVVLLCSIVIFALMSVCLISSYWMTAEGFRQGLLYLCIEEIDNFSSKNEPLPFDLGKDNLEAGCYPNRDVAYLKVCTILCLITLLSALATVGITGIGTRLRGLKRISCLRFSICTTLVTLLCDICLLIVYPISFAKELDKSNRNLWQLNSAYGLACGSAIIALGSLVLLLATFARNMNVYESPPTRI